MDDPACWIKRARMCLGSRFRLHGRDPEHGLDCVGLIGFACRVAVPSGYALRWSNIAQIEMLIDARLARAQTPTKGCVALVRAGHAQCHLILYTDTGFIHADASARRVVERPGPSPWPVIGIWQRDDHDKGSG